MELLGCSAGSTNFTDLSPKLQHLILLHRFAFSLPVFNTCIKVQNVYCKAFLFYAPITVLYFILNITMHFLSTCTVLITILSQAVSAQTAFPGALGFGAQATGGNSGTTVHVTNLNDTGSGSLRDAVSVSNRNIIFDVSGYINLTSALILSSHLTIDGSTAPAPGIGVMGREVSASGKTNIIIQDMRFRHGLLDPESGKSCFNMGGASLIMIDHCSFAYGQWDTIDAVKTVNFTVSNSIIAFPIGQQFGAHVETGPSTFYGNLWVSAHNRQPLSKDNTQFVNNVIYNYQAGYTAGNTGGNFSHDILGNYFIAGPSTSSANDAFFQMNANQKVFAQGNYLDSDKDGVLNGAILSTAGSAVMVTEPWAGDSLAMMSLTAEQAVTAVLANAGAMPRDQIDELAVANARTLGKDGTLYKDQANTGLANDGYGTL